MEKCLYDQWMDGQILNLNTFTTLIFHAFQAADGTNKQKIIGQWPEWFKGSENI